MYLFHCNFSSCSESAEISHADSFCVKIFFKQAEKYVQNSTTPLSLSVSKQCRILRTKTLCMCVLTVFPPLGERGGGLSWTCLKPCFPACGKKKTGTFFYLKNCNEIHTYASLSQNPSMGTHYIHFHRVRNWNPGVRNATENLMAANFL